jgi:hypothetical protein
MTSQNVVVASPLLIALERLGEGVRRRASRRRIGEIRTVVDRRPYWRDAQQVEAALLLDQQRFPDEEHYFFPEKRPYVSPEDKLTAFLKRFMRDAKSTVSAQQLKFDL